MSRAYLRLDPACFEHKFIEQGYSPSEFAAFVGMLCLAETQPDRGRFRDERLLRALLGGVGRHVARLIELGDLVRLEDGRLYVDGWDEWQEGDVTVRDRMARLRARKRNPHRNASRNGHRHSPSPPPLVDKPEVGEGVAEAVTELLPPPPTSGGRRSDGTNRRAQGTSPRDEGTNPRALGESPRQDREAQKRGPTALPDILSALAAKGGAA